MTKIYEGARILIEECGGCKKDENIVIVTDTTTMDVGMALWEATKDYPNKSLILMDDRTAHSEEPTAMVAAAMKAADVTFNPTKYSINITKARRDACANGTRSVNMVDYTLDMLESGGLFTDWEESEKMVDKFASVFEGKIVHVTTPAGTDITLDIEGFKPIKCYGRVRLPGTCCSPPDVECAVFAKPGTGEGVIVADASMTHPLLGVVEDDHVKMHVKDGCVVKIEGGKNAETLKKILSSHPDPRVYNIGEVAVGLNKACKLVGRMLEDEGVYRTVHIALGSNMWVDDDDVQFHMDMMQWNPTITVDGRTIMKDGEIVWD